jgi:hypothetical protein
MSCFVRKKEGRNLCSVEAAGQIFAISLAPAEGYVLGIEKLLTFAFLAQISTRTLTHHHHHQTQGREGSVYLSLSF